MKENLCKDAIYVEPKEYIPEEIRKEFKIGEYAETEENEQTDD